MRKLSEVWGALEEGRTAANMTMLEWTKSFQGVSAALRSIGLQLLTTVDEFAALEIPVDRRGRNCYGHRKVIVSRDGKTSTPTRIIALLTGQCGLLTEVEREAVNDRHSQNRIAAQPKGIAGCNNAEATAIEELDHLVELDTILRREHLTEFRLADMGYALLDDDSNGAVFVGDQVKSGTVCENGQVFYSYGTAGKLNVGAMLEILAAGMSLTCIGKHRQSGVDVVWLFHGNDAVRMLNGFDKTIRFEPRLHLGRLSYHPFTNAYNDPQFRFDVGRKVSDRARLRARRVEIVDSGIKRSLRFLNEDDSQIPCQTHRVEQRSFTATRKACAGLGATVERLHEDAYGSVDFRVNGKARIQDKVSGKTFNVRRSGGYPFDPDTFDVLQVSDLGANVVYALPMRIKRNDGGVDSFFTARELMRNSVTIGKQWREQHAAYRHDLKTEEGARSYVNACEEAAAVPQLTERAFYANMIAEYAAKFGSKKQLKGTGEAAGVGV